MKGFVLKAAKESLLMLGRVETAFHAINTASGATPRPTLPREVNSVLVWSMDRIGDVVRGTPALRGLARQFPSAHRTAVVAGRAAPVLLNSPRIHDLRVIRQPYNLAEHMRLVRDLKQRTWDVGVLLECDPYWRQLGQWVFRALGVQYFSAFRFGSARGIAPVQVKIRGRGSWIDQFNGLVSPLGIDESSDTELFISPAEREWAQNFLYNRGIDPFSEFILMHPGGNFLTVSRQWPAASFADLITAIRRECDYPIVLTGVPQERAAIAQIRRRTNVPVVDLAGQLNLRQLMAVIAQATLCVMNDTGPLHIANALRVPAVAILGPTGPDVVGLPSTCAPARLDLPCSPCAFYLGWQACSNPKRWACLSDLSVDQVFGVVKSRLAAIRAAHQHATDTRRVQEVAHG